MTEHRTPEQADDTPLCGEPADARRTEMTTDATQTSYARAALSALAAELPGEDLTLLRLYTLLALTKGRSTTLEDVHDAWALWRLDTRPDHPSLVPFDELSHEVQELDRPYMEAIHRAAEALSTPGQGDGAQPELLQAILAAIDHALRNGSAMTGANYAFELLCIRLGVVREALRFDPRWHEIHAAAVAALTGEGRADD